MISLTDRKKVATYRIQQKMATLFLRFESASDEEGAVAVVAMMQLTYIDDFHQWVEEKDFWHDNRGAGTFILFEKDMPQVLEWLTSQGVTATKEENPRRSCH